MTLHVPEHVFVHSGRSVVLVAKYEKYVGLEIRHPQMLECKHTHFQEILKLTRNLAFVVDQNQLGTCHR
jgi:hypothetical protein